MNVVTPVLLAGGSGTRLWPESRKSYPKQFLKLINDKTLFQQSTLRNTSSANLKFNPHIVMTKDEYRFVVCEQLLEVGINPKSIIIEPFQRNTAPAILCATLLAHKKNKEAILLICPSDHIISDKSAFHEAINLGIKEIHDNQIITFGVQPSFPEVGYGYLELEDTFTKKVTNLKSFIEKPSKIKAEEMFSSKKFLWNSGIFLFKAKDMISLYEEHASDMVVNVRKSIENAVSDLGFLRLEKSYWSECKSISIDYAIMEKAKNLSVVPFLKKWSDLGDWNSVWKEMDQDKNGVALSKNAFALNCENALLKSESDDQVIFGLGLKDIIAIAMRDAVLVCNKNETQNIKEVVKILDANNISQGKNLQRDFRPWGYFDILFKTNYFVVKKISLKPKSSISLQSHKFRSEHWIVVEGKAKVQVENEIKLVSINESVSIPIGAIHRLENLERTNLTIIEVQIGSYLEEDDIVRYKDDYNRN
ncbi:MAG: mannose-1-phosphate guanylyltransferase/mannose-6-phosphate isomerase [Candidatus Endolissoclinum sp. TMED37]|nr:MAG: mannose-1-phosphate guanylyltransferase/mannose-6-phosphate isomerase [Candidatus Endolissoclinum sp. TMED37]